MSSRKRSPPQPSKSQPTRSDTQALASAIKQLTILTKGAQSKTNQQPPKKRQPAALTALVPTRQAVQDILKQHFGEMFLPVHALAGNDARYSFSGPQDSKLWNFLYLTIKGLVTSRGTCLFVTTDPFRENQFVEIVITVDRTAAGITAPPAQAEPAKGVVVRPAVS